MMRGMFVLRTVLPMLATKLCRTANLPAIQQSCQNNGWGRNNDAKEITAIKNSIEEESKTSGIPKELILAVIMQESNGCVRVITTQSDSNNPGLMQSAGQATCHPLGAKPITPCPTSTIRQMIRDGTSGERLRTTLKNSLDSFDPDDDSKWYKTVRRYNAGSSMDAGNLGSGPTPCYASDIANRLINPSSRSSCDSNEIKTLTRAKTAYSFGHHGVNLAVQDEAPVVQPSSDVAPPKLNKGLESNNGGIAQTGVNHPSDPIIAGAAIGCAKYYNPQPGASCQSVPVDLATLRRLNTN